MRKPKRDPHPPESLSSTPTPAQTAGGRPSLTWPLLAALILTTSSSCITPARPELVMPNAPVLQTDGDASAAVSVQALLVAFEGAEGAPPTVTRSREEAEQRAALLANSASSGEESFDTLIQSYSDRPPLTDPGPHGLQITRDSTLLPPAVVDAAFRLSPQSVSEPVLSDAGYYVVMRTADGPIGPAQVGAKHILISHRDSQRVPTGVTRSREEAQMRAEEVRGRVEAGSESWDALADEYTDEPGAQSGGDLGTFGRGQMVPAFEKAAFALEVGEVSRVVETPFGFHVIRRYK